MSFEMKINMKTEHKSLSQKFYVEEGTKLDILDPEIQRCINEITKEFGETSSHATVKISINLEL